MRVIKLLLVLIGLAVNINAEPFVATSVQSQYMGINGAIFLDKPVMQTTLMYHYENNISLGVWHSVGLNDNNLSSDFGDEIDLMLLWDYTFTDWQISFSLLYINAHELSQWIKGDALYNAIRLNSQHGFMNIYPFINLEMAVPTRGVTPGAGYLTSAGGMYSHRLAKNLNLRLQSQLVYDSGAFGFDTGLMNQTKLQFGWQANSLSVNATLRLAEPIIGMSQRVFAVQNGLSVNYNF